MSKFEDISSGHIGIAGEHAVASELLFRGYNTSLMSVDVGIDLVAIKDSKTYYIQVKTATINDRDYYAYDLRVASFERHENSQTFYVFVLRNQENNFLILPYTILKEKISQGDIKSYGQGKYRVNIFVKDEDIFIASIKSNSLDYYLNNWEIIR